MCALAATGGLYRRAKRSVARENKEAAKRRVPPGLMGSGTRNSPSEVSIVMTDVQGSTELWEWDDMTMDRALELHDTLMRSMMPLYCGHEVLRVADPAIYTSALGTKFDTREIVMVITEGDSFTVAFHDPLDAVAYCVATQLKLLEVCWPASLCNHPQARQIPTRSGPGRNTLPMAEEGSIFSGLRVRMAVGTGIPQRIRIHHVTKQNEYIGQMSLIADALLAVATGGMILMSSATFIAVNGRLHELADVITANDSHMIEVMQKVHNTIKWSSFFAQVPLPWSKDRTWKQGKRRPKRKRMTFPSLMENSQVTPLSAAGMSSRLLSRQAGRSSSVLRSFALDGSMGDGATKIHTLVQDTLPSLVHMGWHAFMLRPGNLVDGLLVEEVALILPARLVPRLSFFPSLHTLEQVGPSFLDAPGCGEFVSCVSQNINRPLPSYTSFLDESSIAFCTPKGYKEIAAKDFILADEMLGLFRECVSESIMACGGYECQENDGTFMAAFCRPRDALEWSCTLHIALLSMPWPDGANVSKICGMTTAEDGTLLFNGLSARVGIFHGEVRTLPHATTGRADYFGAPVNRAARLQSASWGGQTLVDEETARRVMLQWKMEENLEGYPTFVSKDLPLLTPKHHSTSSCESACPGPRAGHPLSHILPRYQP
eukprot:evm.model.scf_479.8 EVM.evm.TU.scf_479.8   scf_479:49921-55992(-)